MAIDQEAREPRLEPRNEPGAAAGELSGSEEPATTWEGYSPEILTVLLDG